jgi:hypothetical protein
MPQCHGLRLFNRREQHRCLHERVLLLYVGEDVHAGSVPDGAATAHMPAERAGRQAALPGSKPIHAALSAYSRLHCAADCPCEAAVERAASLCVARFKLDRE